MAAGTRFDLLIFDFDGTLCDTRVAIAHCLERALGKYGRPIPAREQTANIVSKGLSLPETIILLDPGLRSQSNAVSEMVSAYRSFYRSEGDTLVKVFPGANAVLQRVHKLGTKCIVVSNKGTEAIHRSLDRFELMPFIDLVLGEKSGVPFKPDPALLNDRIAPKFPQIAKARMLMIGDTEVDIKFAHASEIACCWAAYGFGDRQHCMALSPEYIIENIDDLGKVIMSSEDV
ncbi:MAG TPA: HAD hydrolase-like protein [Xanthobacteraceae bacterium]|nr:HAD hydrolase-like protein [Xanthobacteraceae bacterium]